MNRVAALLVVLVLSSLSFAAKAEVYCVSTAAQLRTALSDAAASSAASEIRVRQGFYSLPAASSSSVSLQYTATSDLKLSGRWDGVNGLCSTQSGDAELTVLSAAGVGRLLSIYVLSGSATNIEINGLSFRQGDIGAGVTGAACVTIESDGSANGTVTIDNNAFRLCNKASGAGSALTVIARSLDVYLRNNVWADNASVAAALYLQGLGGSTLYVSNNTLANNPQFGVGGGPGGVQVSGQPTDLIWFTNNVLWNNGTGSGYDLLVNTGTPMVLNSNLIGEMAPLPAGVVNNNTLNVDPRFTNTVNFYPRSDSPLRNSGVSPNGGIPVLDFAGALRVQGPRIDRGAYEFDELFVGGFE